MKIIALGDIHGRNSWQQIIQDNDDNDLIIIEGDYFDSRDKISAAEQMYNFKEIIAFKEANMDKVILLIGNHCEHYFPWVDSVYSGYQHKHALEIQQLLVDALDKGFLQMCYIHGKFLFSHAGVTKTWANYVLGRNDFKLEDGKLLEQLINDQFKNQPMLFHFSYGNRFSFDPSGDDIFQSPIWVRPKSLMKDKLDNFIMIVGHTSMKKLDVTGIQYGVIFTDCLGTSGEYLKIDDQTDELTVGKVDINQ